MSLPLPLFVLSLSLSPLCSNPPDKAHIQHVGDLEPFHERVRLLRDGNGEQRLDERQHRRGQGRRPERSEVERERGVDQVCREELKGDEEGEEDGGADERELHGVLV